MNRIAVILVLCAGFFPFLYACAQAPVWPPTAAELRPGEEACASCRMFVSDPRFAVQRHTPDGALEWFDDLGCLLQKYGPEDRNPEGVFVHALMNDDWLNGKHGYLIHTADIDSPMGFGWCAYPTLESARVAAELHADAELISITDLLRGEAAASPQESPAQVPETPQSN